jgi:hypothetical protein
MVRKLHARLEIVGSNSYDRARTFTCENFIILFFEYSVVVGNALFSTDQPYQAGNGY